MEVMCVPRRRQILVSSILPVVLFLLVGLCAATEYYVKPTISQETSCPRESCYTLDELATKYFYIDATDVLVDNVTVILLSGRHELDGSIYVKEVNNFTLLGVNEYPVEIKCKSVSSLVFIGILNLTITRITFSQCGNFSPLRGMITRGALIFMDMFNLKMTWVVIRNSTKEAMYAVNVLGNSLIDHLTFETDFEAFLIGHGIRDTFFDTFQSKTIYVHYGNSYCHSNHPQKCSNKTLPLLLAVNSHKLSIHNSVLTKSVSNSVSIDL